ncbi:hypothetical protein J6Z39_03005 [bacterium]|nr:hypothetical protein [bacterium]
MSCEKIVVFGITGSIGQQTERIVAAFPEKFRIVACSAGKNVSKLAEILPRHQSIKKVVMAEKCDVSGLKFDGKIAFGKEAMLELLSLKPDKIVMALPGKAGWEITVAAINMGIQVCLANKESLVIAGYYLGSSVTGDRKKIVPVDSEHAALMQLLEGRDRSTLRQVYITASGGALRDLSASEMAEADAATALRHPVWQMGAKVTIDSATLLNKGLELFEAFWLFNLEPEILDVLVHPEVNVHAALLFKDGSSLSQNAVSSMLVPIAAALSYPQMLDIVSKFPEMNFSYDEKVMEFRKPDLVKYPLLATAFRLLLNRDYSGMVAYAISDEVAVNRLLKNEIRVKGIHETVMSAVSRFSGLKTPSSVADIAEFINEIEQYSRGVI